MHGISFASGSADVLGYKVFPSSAYCSRTSRRISTIRSDARTVSSRRRISDRALERVSCHESFLALSNRGSFSMLDASFALWSKEHLVESHVFSVVIRVFAGSTSASVRMHRKRASRSRFVKDVVSLLWRLSVFRNRQASRKAQGPSVPGPVRFDPSYRKLVFGEFQFGRECDVAYPERVARTFWKYR